MLAEQVRAKALHSPSAVSTQTPHWASSANGCARTSVALWDTSVTNLLNENGYHNTEGNRQCLLKDWGYLRTSNGPSWVVLSGAHNEGTYPSATPILSTQRKLRSLLRYIEYAVSLSLLPSAYILIRAC